MKTRPAKHLLSGSTTDIRASRRSFRAKRSAQTKVRGLCLIASDILSISAAWKLAQFLNQFYSPVPSPFRVVDVARLSQHLLAVCPFYAGAVCPLSALQLHQRRQRLRQSRPANQLRLSGPLWFLATFTIPI